ncbi:MAG TPA: 3-hydroxyacyl-CoA dehydrogenase [Rhodospirillaceae bacterium]|nr:3-hydroxyacyl-CoA dehydrogenase [Candidatus Neomarinimicrobiota bacterium]HCX13794.1 3-hydroxyacyl-CoA dehydrogenase [Rhodospirillaceae bacterium]
MVEIKQAAVIGAGVMGASIAAHISNAGVPVVLLDIVPKGGKNRNAIAEGAVSTMLKTEPAPFMSAHNASKITTGNIDDDLGLLAGCDWIVEAIIERLDIKQDLYKKIEIARKKNSIVSSNTSTIPLKELTRDMPAAMVPNFIITHFFNPPRYMRLLEVVASDRTNKEVVDAICDFGDISLGKGVVMCKDTPGFIANRIGSYWGQCGIKYALEYGLTVDEADAVGSRPFGIPKTGFFGLMDLVGLDLIPHVSESMVSLLPKSDDYHRVASNPAIINTMIKNGWIGRKGPSGFYRLKQNGGSRIKESINLKTADYNPSVKPRLESLDAAKKHGLQALMETNDKGGKFAWAMTSQALVYTAGLVPEIADTVFDIDEAMKDGYGWSSGPFEIIDKIGASWLTEKLASASIKTPDFIKLAAAKGGFYRIENGKRQYLTTKGVYKNIVRPEGVLNLSDIKLSTEPVFKNPSAKVWDIGDSVLCFEFVSRANSLDPMTMAAYKAVLKLFKNDRENKWKALVIYNEGPNFSVGANVGLMLFAANIAAWGELESQVEDGQKTYLALKQAPFPVVSAPLGMALGGGCEVLLHSDAIQAHSETYAGLVEVGVGVIPGWGGCKEMMLRFKNDPKIPQGPMPAVIKSFEMIGTAQVSRSAAQAREMNILRREDGITMNRDRLLADAKKKALSLAKNYIPPENAEISLPGPSGAAGLKLALDSLVLQGKATTHDQVVAEALSKVLSGRDTDYNEKISEKNFLKIERDMFMTLARNEASLARMEYMLDNGKPLRN